MTQTKLPSALLATAALLTSCGTDQPVRWDESVMVIDSIIQLAADGHVICRQAYYYDSEGRDTLMTFESDMGRGEAKSEYNIGGKVERRLVTSDEGVTSIEYTYDWRGDLQSQEMTTRDTGEVRHVSTIFTNDSTGRQTLSHSVTNAGGEVMISMTYDSHGNKLSETISRRRAGDTGWTNEQQQEWDWVRDSSKWNQSAARLLTWENGDWYEVSSERNKYKNGKIVSQEQRADDVTLVITTEYDEVGNVMRQLTYSTHSTDAAPQQTDLISERAYRYNINCKVETTYTWASGAKEANQITYTFAH